MTEQLPLATEALNVPLKLFRQAVVDTVEAMDEVGVSTVAELHDYEDANEHVFGLLDYVAELFQDDDPDRAWVIGVSICDAAQTVAEVARKCARVWEAQHVPVVLSHYPVDDERQPMSRRFPSRFAALEWIIGLDSGACDDNPAVLLGEGFTYETILADYYDSDAIAMALDIGTSVFDDFIVEVAQ